MTPESNLDRRILVVEDEPDLRELLTYNLTAAGFKFYRGEKAREFFGISLRPKPAFDGNYA